MNRLARVAAIALVGCVGTALAATQTIARIGSREITADEFRAELRDVRTSGNLGAALRTMGPEGHAAVLQEMVERELLALAATKAGIEQRPDVAIEVRRAVARILAAKYAEAVMNEMDSSESVLRSYYERHKRDFVSVKRVKARHVLLKSREQAEQVIAALRQGADFAELARTRSEDPQTRDKGGELGWIASGVMVKPFEDALFALERGATSGVVASSYGFHVIRVDDVEPETQRSFEAVRDVVRETVRRAHLDSVRARLRAEFPVTIDSAALEALQK